MSRRPRPFTWLLFALMSFTAARAQQEKPIVNSQPTGSPVTIAASGAGVRFTAFGAVERMRLEVFDQSGQPVFDTGFLPGNVRDWRAADKLGQRLGDGTYLCVVTIKEVGGRLSFKQGTILVQNGQASQALDGGEPGKVESGRETLSARDASEPAVMTVVGHDGEQGQVTSTTGPLTFRTGDVLAGKDKEQMRITPDGKVGIGTKEPQAALDVRGAIRTTKGIAFPDGTVQTTGLSGRMDSEGNITPNVAGTGTQGQLAKWTDNAGTLGDSIVTESAGGNIGVGTTAPNSKLHVAGNIEVGAAAGSGINPTLQNPNNLANFSQLLFYPAAGTSVNSSFSIIPRGTGPANNRAQLVLLNTDRVASPTNFEFASFRARGADYVLATGKVGSGLDRPLMLAAGFLTNNTTNNGQLFLATNGNVGVGTTTPAAKLHVAGAVNFTGLRTEGSATGPNVVGGASANSVAAGVVGATIGGGGSSNFPNSVIADFGTVGGGNSNVAGNNSTVSGGVSNEASGGTSTVGGGNGNVANGGSSTVGGGVNNAAGGGDAFIGGGSSNNAGGNNSTVGGGNGNNAAGVGATVTGGQSNTASNSFSTVGGGQGNNASGVEATVPGGLANIAQGDFSFAAGHAAQAAHQGSFVWSDTTSGPSTFFTSTAPNQFLIHAAGGVGIGTNAPAAPLHVAGSSSSNVTPIAVIESSGGQVPLAFRQAGTEVARLRATGTGDVFLATLAGTSKNIHFRAGNDSNSDLFIEAATNNVGIGTVGPTARLDVSGTLRVRTLAAATSTTVCRDANNVIAFCSSSLRYKEHVAGFRPGLSLVNRLRPVSFRWKGRDEDDFGLIAEEVERAEPLMVTHNEHGEVEGVKYDRLGVVLINAVKEQQEQIKKQQAEIEALKQLVCPAHPNAAACDHVMQRKIARGNAHHPKRSLPHGSASKRSLTRA